MKILHVTPAYIPAYRYGGPIRIVHELNKWLVKAGAEVTVYTTNIDGLDDIKAETGKEILIDGVKVVYFPWSFPRFRFNSKEMEKALSENIGKFNVVHITSTFLATSKMVSKYALMHKIPYVISMRGNFMKETFRKKYWKKKIYYELFEKKVLLNAAAIHFTSELEYREYKEQGFPVKKPIIVANGIDNETFRDVPEKGYFRTKLGLEDKNIVLFMSRISWKKGFDTLIPAMKEVLKEVPNAHLVIAGGDDEGYKKKVEGFIKENGLSQNVIFTGMLQGKDHAGAYEDTDVFVLPSYAENFANVVLEAMYFGLPVVATEGVALAKDVAEVGAGLMIKKDVKELANSLSLLLLNREISHKMGERGRELVRDRFLWGKIAEQMLEEYNKLNA